MTTGERIKYLRLKKGLSQEELGARVGVQKAAVHKWENGIVVNLKRPVIQKLAEVLEVSPLYLDGYEDINEDRNDDANPLSGVSVIKKQFVDSVLKLSDQDVVYLQQMLDLFLSTKK